jgi:putative DNA methylase
MPHRVKSPKKLIEVALPLDAINKASAREKSIRHGHPSTLHLWWARRPLAAARAVIFGQMVNDPSWKWEMEHRGEVPPSNLKASWAASRNRLFAILEELVKWENTTNEKALEKARVEIRKSWRETCELNKDHPEAAELFNPEKLPSLHDPFAGGGTIPLEAKRLGLEAYASDLNPVAVLINKAMIEIPPKFSGDQPVNPEWKCLCQAEKVLRQCQGAQGLAEDVRYYGQWMRDETQKLVGHLYPEIEVTAAMAETRPDLEPIVGQKLTVIAWLWARTVKSPNPAFRHVYVPLVSTFILSSKEGNNAYVQPVVDGDTYRFTVRLGKPPADAKDGTKLARANFRCLVSGSPINGDYIRAAGQAGEISTRLMAIVAEGNRGRVYLGPTPEHEEISKTAKPQWKPELKIPTPCHDVDRLPMYGMPTWGDAFTARQLVVLTTLSDLVDQAMKRIQADAVAAGFHDDGVPLRNGGAGALAYAEAVGVYLSCALGKTADYNSAFCSWISGGQTMRNTFGRQAIPMVWDFAEANTLSRSTGSYASGIDQVVRVIRELPAAIPGYASQTDAQSQSLSVSRICSTDPPYYDNVGYADLSDFFYVWLRQALRPHFPELFATVAVPKEEELVASVSRHGSKKEAEKFFLDGMTKAMHRLAEQAHPAFPVAIYYAFKQSETEVEEGTVSTGWETFLDGVIRAGFSMSGTWPIRTELANKVSGIGRNMLASSIVLVCHAHLSNASTVSRRAFVRELNQILPEALDEMTRGAGRDLSPVRPVDLSQAIIGPGIAVFSKYSAVLEADGNPMSVRTALQLINRFLAEDDFDHDTQFCLHWFAQYAWKDGKFGDADTLARAKGTSVEGMKQAGVVYASGGVVRLLKWSEYPTDWDPAGNTRLPVWEVLHQLIRVFNSEGESGAGAVLAGVQAKSEATRQLAYRLYTLCERAGWAEDARAYNEIITSWSAIESAATRVPAPKQGALFDA